MNEDLYVDISCMNDVLFMVQTRDGKKRFKNLEFSLWITLNDLQTYKCILVLRSAVQATLAGYASESSCLTGVGPS